MIERSRVLPWVESGWIEGNRPRAASSSITVEIDTPRWTEGNSLMHIVRVWLRDRPGGTSMWAKDSVYDSGVRLDVELMGLARHLTGQLSAVDHKSNDDLYSYFMDLMRAWRVKMGVEEQYQAWEGKNGSAGKESAERGVRERARQ